MRDQEETRLRELFHRLKTEDELSAPPFSQTLDGQQRRDPVVSVWSFKLRLAVCLFAVILFAVPLMIYLTQASFESGEEFAVDVLEWESPTDFLLTYLDEPLLITVPTVEIEVPYWAEEGALEHLEKGKKADDS
jgi:hypothetical protein